MNKFAAEYFDGGGHKNASGGKSTLSLRDTVERFESLVEENQDDLYRSVPVTAD